MVENSISLEDIVINTLAILIIAIFSGAIYAFIRSIFLFIFSGGDAENKKKARNWIRFMIIGVLMSVGLLFVFQFGLKFAGIENYEMYSAKNVFTRVGVIFGKIFALTDGINSGNTVPGVRVEPGVNSKPGPSQDRSLDPSDYEL